MSIAIWILFFTWLQGLRFSHAQNNDLSLEDINNYVVCRQCECYRKSHNVTCIGIIETDRLATLPHWTRAFYAWECSLPWLTRDAFVESWPNLRKIQIWGSDLTKIEQDAFAKLANLESLDLSDNPLNLDLANSGELFHSLTNLRYLNLSNVHVSDFAVLDQRSFAKNLQITELNLSRAYIKGLSRPIRLLSAVHLDLSDLPVEYFYGDHFVFQQFPHKVSLPTKTIRSLNINRCGAVLKPSFFQSFRHLESLSASPSVLDYGQLDIMERSWTSLRKLNLSLARFRHDAHQTSTWRHFPPALQILDVSNMLLHEIRIDRVHTQLRRLYLSRNELTDFPHMKNVPNLSLLDLSHNRLYAVPFPPEISPMNDLTYLDLSDNQIETLIFEAFENLPNLRTVKLNNNRLRYFGTQMLTVLPQLEELELTGNILEYFDFNTSGSLQKLDLHENKLRGITATCHCCEKLVEINLAKNPDLKLCGNRGGAECDSNSNMDSLLNLSSLVTVDLTSTGLNTFPTALIAKLGKLRYLSVAENEISSYGLQNELINLHFNDLRIDFLNLSANQITTISPSLSDMLAGSWLIELDMSKNDLFCTCAMVAAFRVLQYKLVRFFGMESSEEHLYECYSERDDVSYSVKQFIYDPRTRYRCPEQTHPYFTNPGHDPSDKASMTIYALLSMCGAAILLTVLYVLWNRPGSRGCSRRSAKDYGQYSTVDYVVLETNGNAPTSAHESGGGDSLHPDGIHAGINGTCL